MLIRNSLSNTKKFFQKTIDNFKSFISKGSTYERLPKTPPFHPFKCGRDGADMDIEAGHKDWDNFYVEFSHQWDSHKSKPKNKAEKKAKKSQEFKTNPPQKANYNHGARSPGQAKLATMMANQSHKLHPGKYAECQKVSHISEEIHAERKVFIKNKGLIVSQGLKPSDLCSRSVRERRLSSVAQKLKELESMDRGNDEHKLDVEEVIHYYSRLTCPAYLDIVDKFFMEICTEFLGPKASPPVNYSTQTLV